MQMSTAQKRKTVAMIDRLYVKLPDMCKGWRDHRQDIFDAAQRGEKQHRSGRPACIDAPRGFSVNAAARYFVVKLLLEYTRTPHTGGIVDMLHLRPDAALAAACAVEFRSALLEWAKHVPVEFDTVDYSVLVS